MERLRYYLPVLFILACGHSEGFETPAPASLGPYGTGPDLQLTFSPDQDYWPAWSQDGRGILYSFANQGSTASHRCLGILPASGGSRIWEMCDSRAVRRDSVSSYTAFALDSSGRLLVVEALSRTGFLASFPFHIRLFLTDTATPYVRTILDTIPVTGDDIGSGVAVSWLSDLAWTGHDTFIALGQQFASSSFSCNEPFPCIDSTFAQNGVVVRGTISGGHATLTAIKGTEGTAGYSLAENGTAVIFMLGSQLYKVPIGGGKRDSVMKPRLSGTLFGVSCRLEQCVVANQAGISPAQLVAVSLTNGSSTVLRTTTAALVVTPIISPATGDIVVQIGGVIGHFATNHDPGSNLFIYKDLFR